jgi:membrane protein implicated in regulation of membrane protease activity
MLTDLRNWVAVTALAIIGLAGLFYAANGDETAYHLGLGVFAVAVVVIAILIRRALDSAEKST